MKQLEDDLLERLKKLVESHIGLCIRKEDIETFRMTLTSRMKISNFIEPEEYLSFLESDTKESKKEWKALILLITTGESYFFRDKGHFFLLQNTILPELIKNKQTQRTLRIWSAGCSTGEEPHSIAILLDMFLPDKKSWEIFIIGTDINEESLKKAERGIYPDWSFRMVDKDIQRKYFKRHQDDWEIDGKIKKMVTFQYGNLMEDDFFPKNPEICNMDIIICRNVFIYFKKEAVSAVFNKFINTLNNEGYLITGHGELYGHNLTSLRQIMYPEAVIYKKIAECGTRNAELGVRNMELYQKQVPESKAKITITKPKDQPKSAVPRSALEDSALRTPHSAIEELIKKGRYAEAAAKAESHLLTSSDKHDMMCLIAQAYANSGDYEKAESVCRRAANINSNSADPYFLLAHIAEARGNDEEAMNLFKKAIYLNPAFIAAYCELGGLYEKENDIPRAKKARTTAIELLKSLPSHVPIKPYDITAGELLKYVEYLTVSNDDNLISSAPGEKSR